MAKTQICYTWLYEAFKGTVVNWALPSFHGGSLLITLTVPLIACCLQRTYYLLNFTHFIKLVFIRKKSTNVWIQLFLAFYGVLCTAYSNYTFAWVYSSQFANRKLNIDLIWTKYQSFTTCIKWNKSRLWYVFLIEPSSLWTLYIVKVQSCPNLKLLSLLKT